MARHARTTRPVAPRRSGALVFAGVVVSAAIALAACGGDDDDDLGSDTTPQGVLADATIQVYEDLEILEVDHECIRRTTSTLTDDQAERALAQIEEPEVDDDLRPWVDQLDSCLSGR